MTLREIVTMVMMPPEGNSISYDARLTEPDYVAALVHMYRADEIQNNFRRNGDLQMTWVQPYYESFVTRVDKNEIGAVAFNKDLGKIDYPQMVQIKMRNDNHLNKAVWLVTDYDSNKIYYPSSIDKMMLMQKSKSESAKKALYAFVGNQMYLKPYTPKVLAQCVFANPMDAYIIDNTKKQSGQLIEGQVYEVTVGSITHNSIVYAGLTTFTAVNPDFIGTGQVYSLVKLRKLTIDDPYPVNDSMVETITKKIWSTEFNIALNSSLEKTTDAREEIDMAKQKINVPVPSDE